LPIVDVFAIGNLVRFLGRWQMVAILQCPWILLRFLLFSHFWLGHYGPEQHGK